MLSDLQTKKLTRYFQVYDIDDDGRIEASDFARIEENVRVLHGAEAGSKGLADAYAKLWERLSSFADGDRDGAVDLDEWLAYWQIALEDDEQFEREVQAINDRLFTVFDVDQSDGIGKNEFADFYGVFGLPVSLAEAVFTELDADGDGSIARTELNTISRQFFRGDDAEEAGNILFGPFGV